MNLALVMDEIFATLEAANIGLNVPGDGPGVRGGVPAPYVELPEIKYGLPGPGLDRIEDLGLTVVFGPANNATVFRTALLYASPSGPESIRAVLMAHTWTSCGTLFVARAEPTLENVAGANPAIAYTFHLDITGG